MIGNNEILNYLLIKEDFLPEPTDIGDGKITIGSGLTDPKWIDLYRKRGNKWSKEDNRRAVLEEIQKRRLWAEQNIPHWNSLPDASQDALLSYRYNYNFTPKNSPKLFKALKDKNYLEAAKQMDATSKNPDFKNGLLKRRKEEQQWFLSGFPELSKPNDFAIPYKYPVPEYPTAAEAYRKSMAPITGNYSQGGQLQNHKQWKDLSYSEKNDIIKVAVRNGITTLPEIRQKYNEFADEGNLYAGGGYVYDMLPQLFASDGVQVRVTSGYRPNSKVQGSGKPSRHSMHEAADIVGDFSAIRRVLDNPESNTAKWMRANGYGYLDETSKTGTKKFWHDQKGDHSHYHIGKDSGIAKKFATSTGITSNAIPIVSSGNYLDIAKAHIRNNEGWSPLPVADGPKNTGWRSVGYGFNDSGFRAKYPQGISKAYENGITKAQAEQELDYILGNMDSHLRKVYGSKWNSFNDNQKAAILDTYYQRPASVVGRNSAFYNAVMRGDNNAVNYLGVAGYNTRNNDRRKLFSSTAPQMPEATQTVQQPLFYQPWNPQAANLYIPYSPLTPYPASIFSPEQQEEYFAKQIAQAQKQQEAEQREKQRQEKADRINRFSLLMNLTDPYSSDSSSSSSTPFVDAVSMLAQRNPIQYFSDGGSISIKPENRGKFTRLKERTGHSASWFKENGTPAQKKMAIFALNSKHWKHGLGGNLFDGGGKKDNNPKPVTTGGAGYIPSTSNIDIRQRLYDNVIPFGYNNPVERIASAVFLNKPSNKQEYVGNRDILDDLWGTYLGIPKNRRHYNPVLKTSKYKPTNSKGSNQDYVSIPFANDDIDHIIKEALWQGERSQLLNPELGTFTVDTGRDKKGQYVSYYDKWDLNPFRGITNVGNKVTNFIGLNKAGDLSFGIGKPIEIYDRIYLDDYYGVPYPYRGATYLPEVTVYGKKKKKALGGNLFKDGGDTKANIPVTYFTQSEAMPLLADNPNRTAVLDEVTVKPYRKMPQQYNNGITNQAANEKADEYADRTSLTPERFLGLMGANIPLAAGALGATVTAPALFDSTIAPLSDYITGSSIAGVPATTWLNTGMETGFAGHGLNHAVNEGVDGWGDATITALEIAPLGKLARPIYEGVVQPGVRLFNSSLTGKWTKIGNREYRLAPNSLGANGAPLESRIVNSQDDVTGNLLKWLGRPNSYRPEKPISQIDDLYFDFKPVQREMVDIWKDKGVNLNRISGNDIEEALKKRWDELVSSRQDRHTIVRPVGNDIYFLHDLIPDKETPYGWRSIGTTQLNKDASGNMHMADINNNTGSVRAGKPATEHGVQEKALNAAIKVAKQEGGEGVVTGERWLSAPKQQHVVQKYHDREVIGNTGQHSNVNMVEERINDDIRRGLPVTGEEETLAKSMLDLRRAGNKEIKTLFNQPFWLLRTPTKDIPVKSTLFDPTIIDRFGKMHIDWNNPNIFRGIVPPILIGTGLYETQK